MTWELLPGGVLFGVVKLLTGFESLVDKKLLCNVELVSDAEPPELSDCCEELSCVVDSLPGEG